MTLLVVSNTVTICCLAKRKRDLQTLTGFQRKEQQQNQPASPEYSLIGLLVAISMAFIILKTPVMIMYVRTLTFVQSTGGKQSLPCHESSSLTLLVDAPIKPSSHRTRKQICVLICTQIL